MSEHTPAPAHATPDAGSAPDDIAPATPEETAGVATAAEGATESGVEPQTEAAPASETEPEPAPEPPAVSTPVETDEVPVPVPTPTPTPAPTPAPAPAPSAAPAPPPAPSVATHSQPPSQFGRVAEDGTVFVRIGQEEREVGSYPGATPEEALAYFGRKFDEVAALAELLHQRVTQTDLSAKEGADGLTRLREAVGDLRAVGDFPALYVRIEDIATAVEVRRTTEAQERTAARAEALTVREAIVAEAEKIAAQPEEKVQWKSSSARMRALLEEWKSAQRGGPKLDRETEQALWHRLSSSRNSFDKMRRVHFAQLGATQGEAKARKEELVAQAEALRDSTDWGQTAGAFKRLMDQWRQAGRAARADDDALWKRFKAAQDAFFAAKDEVAAAENVEFEANLKVKEELLEQARALLPVTDIEAAKAKLRPIQEKWDAAGKVPRSAMERIEKGMRKVEQTIRDAEQQKWKRTDPEVAARAHSMVTQLEAAVQSLRESLAQAEAGGDTTKIAKAKDALEAREAWLAQARSGLEEFGG
ncbi:DUF349 domain-containing protein [Mobilicoccus caccae]|uniref:DUF349 domain-containing protein n=1 Tax=Mobilicoccus caccae TaxID=1859295 RepID=A0ABQ6INZ9_9MICO|nr:DUF349 domain-containing protein [Mobilicoccus caccae]GMA39650.1 hypothetical protein GCM10025883_16950 [Mobilicoccus caccae]